MVTRKGGEYITRYEAEQMCNVMLKEYEREIVEPRHRETQNSLIDIQNLIQQGLGMFKLGGIVFTLASFFWIVVQIRQAVGK